jgi:hypothetical protein
MLGDKWAYHILYGIIEIIITVLILVKSMKWEKKKIRDEVPG